MDRILQGVSATLNQTVLVDGVGTDPTPDAATVTITRANGTILYTDAVATNGPNGGFDYVLSPIDTALLDTLTAQWRFTLAGQVQTLTTRVEIVGGYLCGLPEIRALDPIQDTATYPEAKVRNARTLAEQIIETECGFAFVPRYSYGRTPPGSYPYLRRVRSALDAYGSVLDTTDLDLLSRGLYALPPARYGRWLFGVEHGLDVAPPDVSRATAILARSMLMQNAGVGGSGFDERATSVVYADAGLTYSTPLVTPGMRGAATGIPECNAVIDRYRLVAIT